MQPTNLFTAKTVKLSCPKGWKFFQDSCYKENHYPKGATGKTSDTFAEALAKCRAEGATLAEMNSDIENILFVNIARTLRNKGVMPSYWTNWWIGRTCCTEYRFR